MPKQTKINTVDDIWSWLINRVATSLRASAWYNGGQPFGLAGYINDLSSRMIGYGWVRQIRVQANSCSIYNSKFGIDFCDSDLSLFNSDTQDYGFGWTPYNASYVPPHGTSRIYNAFQYKSASELDGTLNKYTLIIRYVIKHQRIKDTRMRATITHTPVTDTCMNYAAVCLT